MESSEQKGTKQILKNPSEEKLTKSMDKLQVNSEKLKSNIKVPEPNKESEELHDPFCDPKNPQKISFRDITSAAFLIKGGIEKTPCPVRIFLISKFKQKKKFSMIIFM